MQWKVIIWTTKVHIYFKQNLFWNGSNRNLWIFRNLTYKCFDMHKLYPGASCNIPPTLVINACLILTTTLSFSPYVFLSMPLLSEKNMKGTCCRCCLTSATSLSHSSLNVFLQDHKSLLSSLVWICVCVCLSQCASMGVHVCSHMHAGVNEDCSLTFKRNLYWVWSENQQFVIQVSEGPYRGKTP